MPNGNCRKRWIGELGSLPPAFTCLFSGTGARGANYAVSTQHSTVSTEEMLLVHWGESKLQESCFFFYFVLETALSRISFVRKWRSIVGFIFYFSIFYLFPSV